ncbi:MAG: helix-turn-helix domain-containing protein [Candidatus Dojkabacteria bacterium]|uniref:Helix-turn-helix domain-containing protein n=2 Tax=Candidatus Dojkabacteria TaxID=74243 RepID=A0A952DUK3_9BACT|nr:helix-turn-helix domain-containing protein [Candidatus Dojkabacteria bacterium]WKZ27996.1 MAG: helix-turn-helix domain-containing protein [Candidatus Dojkabacteria bacterium]
MAKKYQHESDFPDFYRERDISIIADLITNNESFELVGMKRVGIASLLKFLLEKKSIQTRLKNTRIIVGIDLNDLVELELLAFWRLTLKRILDRLEDHEDKSLKEYAQNLFTSTIQIDESFMTYESVRTLLRKITETGIYLTLIYIRFDRISALFNLSFQNNLAALIDATQGRLNFVLTGHRRLSLLSPETYTATDFLPFLKVHYIKPADAVSTQIQLNALQNKITTRLSKSDEKMITELCSGHSTYLQLLHIYCSEKRSRDFQMILKDERIQLQSEELLMHLNTNEKEVIKKLIKNQQVSENEFSTATYLWDTGILDNHNKIFSRLFEGYVKKIFLHSKPTNQQMFTKKENLLYTYLERKSQQVCTREELIRFVWPEYEHFGVSDWTIDRLVSRLRKKMQNLKPGSKLETIKTRGFRLLHENDNH